MRRGSEIVLYWIFEASGSRNAARSVEATGLSLGGCFVEAKPFGSEPVEVGSVEKDRTDSGCRPTGEETAWPGAEHQWTGFAAEDYCDRVPLH